MGEPRKVVQLRSGLVAEVEWCTDAAALTVVQSRDDEGLNKYRSGLFGKKCMNPSDVEDEKVT